MATNPRHRRHHVARGPAVLRRVGLRGAPGNPVPGDLPQRLPVGRRPRHGGSQPGTTPRAGGAGPPARVEKYLRRKLRPDAMFMVMMAEAHASSSFAVTVNPLTGRRTRKWAACPVLRRPRTGVSARLGRRPADHEMARWDGGTGLCPGPDPPSRKLAIAAGGFSGTACVLLVRNDLCRAAALGQEQNCTRPRRWRVDLHLGCRLLPVFFLFPHGQQWRELRIRGSAWFVGVVDAAGDVLPRPSRRLSTCCPPCPSRWRCRCPWHMGSTAPAAMHAFLSRSRGHVPVVRRVAGYPGSTVAGGAWAGAAGGRYRALAAAVRT